MSTTLVYHTVDIFVPDELSEGAGKMIVKLKENANKLFSTELRILPIFSIFFVYRFNQFSLVLVGLPVMASHYFRNFHVNCTKKKRRQLINALVHMRVLLSQARHLQYTLSVVFFFVG